MGSADKSFRLITELEKAAMKKAVEENRLEIARKLKQNGVSMDVIVISTGLSQEKVISL